MAELEVEAKFLCEDDFVAGDLLAALRRVATVGEPEVVNQVDVYYDTRSRSLAKAGLSARCRRRGRRRTLTIKPVLIDPRVTMSRTEISRPLEPRGAPGPAVRRLAEESLPVKIRGVPVEQAALETRRRRYRVIGDRVEAELCVDTVRARRPGRRGAVRFGECELELVRGEATDLEALAGVMSSLPTLLPSRQSKYERSLRLLGSQELRYKTPLPEIAATDTVDAVARAVGRAMLATIRAYEPGTRAGLDVEQLHKMRVATRRLRSALGLFGGCFAQRESDYIDRNLRWLASVLGDVRDLDVQLLALAGWRAQAASPAAAGWDRLGLELERRREEARSRLLEALDAYRYRRLLERAAESFASTPRRRRNHPGSRAIGELAAQAIERRAKKVRRALLRCRKTGDMVSVHRLRLAFKKLRYTTELFTKLLDARDARRLSRLARVQDALGLMQDSVVTRALALELAGAALEGGADPAYTFVLGRIAGSSAATAEHARERVDVLLRELKAPAVVDALVRASRKLAKATLAAAAKDES